MNIPKLLIHYYQNIELNILNMIFEIILFLGTLFFSKNFFVLNSHYPQLFIFRNYILRNIFLISFPNKDLVLLMKKFKLPFY